MYEKNYDLNSKRSIKSPFLNVLEGKISMSFKR